MVTDSPTRVLAFMMLIMACGCGTGSVGPAAAPPAPAPPAVAPPAVGPPAAAPPAAAPRAAVPPPSPIDAGPAIPAGASDAERFAMVLGNPPEPRLVRARAVDTGDPELDPLVSFLRASFAREIAAGKKLIVGDRFDLHHLHLGESYDEMVASLMKEASDQVPAGLIRDFCEKNRRPAAVWPELARHLPARVLSREEHDAIFHKGPGAGWERFYEEYPDAACWVYVARVGLSPEKDRALLYMGFSRGPENGGGQLHVLKKEGGEWVELPVRIGSSWAS